MSAVRDSGSAPAPDRPNIDPREAARFTALASAWWDPSGPFWPLHRLNALRAVYLRDVLAREFGRDASDPLPLSGLDVVDIGCGGGILSESMARMGARVHGIDVVARNIEIARQHAGSVGLEVRYDITTVEALAATGARYDVMLNMEVVEHVPDVDMFMDHSARLLRPGGAMTLATLNRTARSWLFGIVGAEYVLGWLPRGTHRWDRFVTPQELRRMLARNGLDVVTSTGVRVNPFNRRFTLSRSEAVNYMLVARRRPAVMQAGRG